MMEYIVFTILFVFPITVLLFIFFGLDSDLFKCWEKCYEEKRKIKAVKKYQALFCKMFGGNPALYADIHRLESQNRSLKADLSITVKEGTYHYQRKSDIEYVNAKVLELQKQIDTLITLIGKKVKK